MVKCTPSTLRQIQGTSTEERYAGCAAMICQESLVFAECQKIGRSSALVPKHRLLRDCSRSLSENHTDLTAFVWYPSPLCVGCSKVNKSRCCMELLEQARVKTRSTNLDITIDRSQLYLCCFSERYFSCRSNLS